MQGGFSLHADTAVHGHDRQGLELGVSLPSRVLPQATAPPRLLLAM